LALEGSAIDRLHRRIADANVAVMQAQAKIDAEALVYALRQERAREDA
jgi:hypothetical protein